MRVKFTLIALTSTESSIHSGSHPLGVQTHSAPCKPGSSVCREGRMNTGVPEQSLGSFRCEETILGTHWSKWEIILCLTADLSLVGAEQVPGPAPRDAQCAAVGR